MPGSGDTVRKAEKKGGGTVIINRYVSHAEEELRVAGLFDETSDYGGMLGVAVMGLIKVFAAQEHSGFSATKVARLFYEMAMLNHLTPLQESDEAKNDRGRSHDTKPAY